MNIDHEHGPLPPSPSLSTASSPCSNQVQFSAKTTLLAHGISSEKADELNSRYNRQQIPIMDDDLFFRILNKIAAATSPEKMESKLQYSIAQESARLQDDYFDAKFEIGIVGREIFQLESEKHHFTTGLRKHTIHAHKGLVAYCLPPLVKACRDNKSKRPPIRTSHKHNRRTTLETFEPAPSSTRDIPRRSDRISRSSPRRSKRLRVKKQVG